MRMNKYVISFAGFCNCIYSSATFDMEYGRGRKKYPKLRADAGDDFKTLENKEVKLDGSDSKGAFKKFVDFEWELVRVNGAKVK